MVPTGRRRTCLFTLLITDTTSAQPARAYLSAGWVARGKQGRGVVT